MSLQPIPLAWRQAVCAALKAGRSSFTELGRKKWEHSFPGVFKAELEHDLLQQLTKPNPVGCPVRMDFPPGTTWEFWFTHQGYRTYGKLLLEEGARRVLILSAHHPLKPKLQCED
jgi:hypothetical protein